MHIQQLTARVGVKRPAQHLPSHFKPENGWQHKTMPVTPLTSGYVALLNNASLLPIILYIETTLMVFAVV